MSKSAPTPKDRVPVVILCGGQGTRLREVTEVMPKPMVEIGERPILWHIMKVYGYHGLQRFVLCLGYKGWVIKQYFLRFHEMHRDFTVTMDGSAPVEYHNRTGDEHWQITCAETGELSGTGGRLARVRDYVDADTFLFTYGDGVADVDVDALLDFHYAQGRIATVTGVHPTSRYGEISVDAGRAIEFNEKPTVAEGVVSGGYFVFQREIFDYLPLDPPDLALEHDPLRNLARDGQLSVYIHDGYWHAMDTYRDYLHLNEVWQRGNAPWKVWE